MKQYFKTHEWIEDIGSGKYRMGISNYACDQLGDIVFVEAKNPGEEFDAGQSLCILESVKAVGDVYAPVKVKLLNTNPDIVASPDVINGDTWLVEVEAKSLTGLETLNDSDYQNFCKN